MEINLKHPCTGDGRAEALQSPWWSALLPHCQQQQPLTPQSQGFKGEPCKGWMNDPQIPSPPKRAAVMGKGEAALTRSAQAGGCADRWPSALLPAKTPGWSGSLTFTDPSLLFIAIPAPCVPHHHPLLPCFLRRCETQSTWDC